MGYLGLELTGAWITEILFFRRDRSLLEYWQQYEKGSANSKPSSFVTAKLVECLGGITECLTLYMFLS